MLLPTFTTITFSFFPDFRKETKETLIKLNLRTGHAKCKEDRERNRTINKDMWHANQLDEKQ